MSSCMTLEEVISKRKSIRYYKEGGVTKEEIDKLLWSASHVPSAGGIHPLKIYVVIDTEVKGELCNACLGQECVRRASIDLVVSANYEPIISRYGKKRGYRYALMEAGHVGQNISLMAVSLGLGTVMIGAFKDDRVKEVLQMTEEPLYVIPVGRV